MKNEMTVLWEKCLPLIEEEVTPISYETWIKHLTPYSMDDNVFVLAADTDIVKTMTIMRYLDLIRNTVTLISGKGYDISIIIASSLPEEKIDKKEENNVFSKYTFENFIVGGSNQFAYAASVAVAEAPTSYNPLFIYGGVGLGKTHLMHAIKNYINQNNKDANVMFVTSEAFTNELILALQNNKMPQFKDKYRKVDFLLIDDIQFIAGKSATEEEFFHTFNVLRDNGSQIVITSDRPPSEIKSLEERLVSRFESGLICDVLPPGYETRMAILKKKAQNEKINIDDDILSYIAEKITSNIRELEGVFNRVIALKGLLQENITLETVKSVLKDYTNDGKSILTPEFIVEYCGKFYKITPDKFYSQSQKKEVCQARQIAFYICKEILDLSFLKIGQVFNRDHSTVIHGIKKIEKEMENDPRLKETVEMLMKDIKNEADY